MHQHRQAFLLKKLIMLACFPLGLGATFFPLPLAPFTLFAPVAAAEESDPPPPPDLFSTPTLAVGFFLLSIAGVGVLLVWAGCKGSCS